ncbi:MAG: hypothetical protein DF168_01941 [Candidatus Moanabacter tarae]|mgnify:FL=1|uniref:Asp23/Gls24 family envelope stress response protein n=1 Tax=Candidatus Moanibacter tarae TaxID=2200854 RepID=A0A2Z4ARN3_9BACT|nr:MAG: hypothetical protein DF168_01941 [Candidatus Moanabacter tarae]|tara:strand:+ start:6393 stop:6863 length:471 start_codon:yes stop_codon:yes gene_type:complete
MPKKKPVLDKRDDIGHIPTISEDSSALGEIKINHKVVANIVQLATLEVEGVVAVAGSNFVDRIEGIFHKKEAGAGIRVELDGNDHYHIYIQVILSFGVELAKTAFNIQTTVRDHVNKMTNKQVAKVDVIIEDIKQTEQQGEKEEETENWPAGEHTD